MAEHVHTPRLTGEIQAGSFRYAWEEYWEEDDAGFCCVDYVLEKHTRLVMLDSAGARLREYDLDSQDYEKSLTQEDGRVFACYHPSWDRKVRVTLDAATGEILSRETVLERA